MEFLKMFIILIPACAISGTITLWLTDKILYFLVKHKIIKLNIFKVKENNHNEINKKAE